MEDLSAGALAEEDSRLVRRSFSGGGFKIQDSRLKIKDYRLKITD